MTPRGWLLVGALSVHLSPGDKPSGVRMVGPACRFWGPSFDASMKPGWARRTETKRN